MKRVGGFLAFVALSTAPSFAEPKPAWVMLACPPQIHGMRRADVDGDGVLDLFVLSGRTLTGWKGVANMLPAAEPAWTLTLPDDTSFVDCTTGKGIVTLGTTGAVRWDLTSTKQTPVPGSHPLGWRDVDGVVFATLCDGRGGLLLPGADGLRWVRAAGDPRTATFAPRRGLEASGPFLEDAATYTEQMPATWLGTDEVWVLHNTTLSRHGTRTSSYALPRPPPTGDRQLHDLDHDGTPEVLQRTGNNREGHYTVFRLQGEKLEAQTTVSLTGYQLDPEFTDVNGDGYDDLVISTISMDGANLLRAVTAGSVTAETNLFLHRGAGATPVYDGAPSARVKSAVGVRLHFTYAGTIDVQRSFTIVTQGDFDGDGRKDLAIRTGPDVMTVRAGTKTGWAQAGAPVAIPPQGDARDIEGYVDDLGGASGDELLLLYRGGTGGRDRLYVVSVGL